MFRPKLLQPTVDMSLMHAYLALQVTFLASNRRGGGGVQRPPPPPPWTSWGGGGRGGEEGGVQTTPTHPLGTVVGYSSCNQSLTDLASH